MSTLDLLVDRAKVVGNIDRAYEAGRVPKKPETPYVVLSLDTWTPSTYSLDSSSDSMHLLSVQIFAKTNDFIEDIAKACDRAFRDTVLTELPGDPMSNRVRATSVVRDPDGESLLYVLHVYRFHQED